MMTFQDAEQVYNDHWGEAKKNNKKEGKNEDSLIKIDCSQTIYVNQF